MSSDMPFPSKRQKTSPEKTSDFFESLPDDLLLSILCKLSATASSPSDFVNVLVTYVPTFLSLFERRRRRKEWKVYVFNVFGETEQVQETKLSGPSLSGVIKSIPQNILSQTPKLVWFCSPFSQALCRCRKHWSLLHSRHGSLTFTTK